MKLLRTQLFGLTILVLMLLPVLTCAAMATNGTVLGVGPDSLRIVSANGEWVEFIVPASAKITRDGRVTPLAELRARDRVFVTSAKTGEEHVATEIHARSPF